MTMRQLTELEVLHIEQAIWLAYHGINAVPPSEQKKVVKATEAVVEKLRELGIASYDVG